MSLIVSLVVVVDVIPRDATRSTSHGSASMHFSCGDRRAAAAAGVDS